MKIRRNDENNDWCFGYSQADMLVDNNIAVAQDIKTSFQEWKNDFFANLEAGIDWRTRLGARNQRKLLDDDVKQIIMSKDEVLSLTKFETYLNDREYTIEFECYTIYSQDPLRLTLNVEGLENA